VAHVARAVVSTHFSSCILGLQGRRDEARETLAKVFGRFTEGFETANLTEARACSPSSRESPHSSVLLCAHRERPRCRAADGRDEIAMLQVIDASACPQPA
jgi:hypothetical protein